MHGALTARQHLFPHDTKMVRFPAEYASLCATTRPRYQYFPSLPLSASQVFYAQVNELSDLEVYQ